MMEYGEQCVDMAGMKLMQWLCVDNLGTLFQVEHDYSSLQNLCTICQAVFLHF